MRKTIKTLKTAFWFQLAFQLLLIVMGENDFLASQLFEGNNQIEFALTLVMELLTIIAIPLTLRLFKFNRVAKELSETKEKALLNWGLVRIATLSFLASLNILFYYEFMSTTFGYLAIILFICMAFVYPSKDKCYFETRDKQ